MKNRKNVIHFKSLTNTDRKTTKIQEYHKMGRQYNKYEKRARRKHYLQRVKERIKDAIKNAKKK